MASPSRIIVCYLENEEEKEMGKEKGMGSAPIKILSLNMVKAISNNVSV